jgi:hypothetical protein
MRVDDVDVFSVLDFLNYVCYDRSNVKMMWQSLENQMSAEVITRIYHLRFNGKWQRTNPFMTILGLRNLLFMLGSKATVEFGDRVLECFNRVLAGDHTLIREITADAVENLPVEQIARATMSMQDPKNYTLETGAPVQEILKGMLGPRCDENRDAFHQLELKIKELEHNDFTKKNMKVEMWTFKADGTTWVNATEI